MLNILIEAAFRSLAIAAGVWFVIVVLRIRNPSVQRIGWLVVATASLSMPLLMQVGTIHISTYAVPGVWDAPQLAAVTVASNDWQRILTAIYWLVCGVLLARLAIGITHTWRLTRNAKRVTEQWTEGLDVRETTAIRAPVTFALTILLPIDWVNWSTTKLYAVVAHEGAHVRNRDFFIQILAQVHRVCFWFSPLAWWLPKQLGRLSELISDDAAIDRLADRSMYARVLLEVARDAHRVPAALSMAQPATVIARVERVLTETQPFAQLRLGVRWSIAMSLMPLVALAASGSAVNDTHASQNGKIATAASGAEIQERIANKRKVVATQPTIDADHPLAKPEYPPQSKLNHETGTVFLALLIGQDGAVIEAKTQKSSGYLALDESAKEIAQTKWQFKAGTVNNQPVPMWVTVPVVFKLDNDMQNADQEKSST